MIRAKGAIRSGFAAVLFFAGSMVSPSHTTDILQYIDSTWKVLRRSNRTLPTAAVDPKFRPDADGKWSVYIPRTEDVTKVERELREEIPKRA